MIVRVTLKDPDGFYESIESALDELRPEGLTDSEWTNIRSGRHSEMNLPFVKYSEYITVEFDTEKKTAVVVETK